MGKAYTANNIRDENEFYQDSLAISVNNASLNFRPAFQDAATGETHLSMTRDGCPATIHLLDGLPDIWVIQRDPDGRVISVKDSIIAGFLREGRFYTRAELSARRLDA